MDANSIITLIKVEANRALSVVTDPVARQALEGILWVADINADSRIVKPESENVVQFPKARNNFFSADTRKKA